MTVIAMEHAIIILNIIATLVVLFFVTVAGFFYRLVSQIAFTLVYWGIWCRC